jgi:hypothetical protein
LTGEGLVAVCVAVPVNVRVIDERYYKRYLVYIERKAKVEHIPMTMVSVLIRSSRISSVSKDM